MKIVDKYFNKIFRKLLLEIPFIYPQDGFEE